MTPPPALDVPRLLARMRLVSERPALSFYRGKHLDGRLSYAELVEKTESLAAVLHLQYRVRQGDRVAILAPNRLEIPVLVLALLRLGAAVVPLNPASAADDWKYILGHSGALGLCATRELAARVPIDARPSFLLHLEDVFSLEKSTPAPAIEGAIDDALGAILYTSGTTGNPKGVALRQRNLIANAWSMAQNFRLDQTTQMAVLPLHHAHAFGFGLMTALTTNGHLVFTERLEPFTWAEVIRKESVEVTSAVPSLLPMLLAAGISREKVPSLRHLMVSSAPLPIDLARQFETRTQIPITFGWGLSEYTNFACCASPFLSREDHQRLMFSWEVPSIGPMLEGSEVRVVDASGNELSAGMRGELLIRGHSQMLGYFRDPETTAKTIDADGFLHSGDEGMFQLHEGTRIFFVTGRLKEIIIRDAEKFSPLRLEQRLIESLPELSGQLVILGFSHQTHGEEVGAYVEREALDDSLRAKLSLAIAAMPLAERPKVVLHGTEAIPRTHTGKIQRRNMQPWFAPWNAHRGGLVIAKRE